MRDAEKLMSRCIYLNILKATISSAKENETSSETLEKYIHITFVVFLWTPSKLHYISWSNSYSLAGESAYTLPPHPDESADV